MPDRPTPPGAPSGIEQPELPARSLSEILSELAMLSHAQQGEASEMRSAVSELSRALARLFEMIRTDRHDQRARIAQLERELAAAHQQLAALGIEPIMPPAPNDFDQLRAAAERLRVRTEQLVREATLPMDEPVQEDEADEAADDAVGQAPESAEVAAGAGAQSGAAALADATTEPGEATLRVLPGGAAPASQEQQEPPAGDVASPVEDEEGPIAIAAAAALPVPTTPPVPAAEVDLAVESELPVDVATPAEPAGHESALESESEPEPEPAAAASVPRIRPRHEPVPVAPRAARKRPRRLRRRRADARKLVDIEPAAALGAMVTAIDPLWTAGHPLDLVVAFTDGGALRVAGGDTAALRVEEVESGTPARCTITATRQQLLPLFGRLELTAAESAPLIHGSRRDADLLVGWLDRVQHLPVAPL